MKKTLTINLNGYVFNIDNDAYETLHAYLERVSMRFADDERDEIMRDIEARIADLFAERLQNRNVVDEADVAAIVETLGQPEQFDSDESDTTPPQEPTDKKQKRKFRKFYRNTDDQMLGGVAAGLAAYLGWDVTAVRLLFVMVLLLGFGWIIPIYLVLWLLLPEAKTAAQKLEMRGIEPNLENIRKYIVSDRFKETAQHVGSRLGEVILWLIKILLIAVCGLVGLVLFAAAICALIAIFAVIVGGSSMYADLFHTPIDNAYGITILVSATLLLLCPAIGLTAACVRLVSRDRQAPRRRWVGWTLLIVWLLSLFTLIGTAIYTARHHTFDANSLACIGMMLDDSQNFDSEEMIEQRKCTPFASIEVGDAIDVQLTQGDACSVAIEARPHELRNIETRVENGVLHIESSGHQHRVVAHVCAPSYQHLEAGDAACIECDGALTLGHIVVEASGASKITLRGSAQRVKLEADEASTIDLTQLDASEINAEASEASTVRLGTARRMVLVASEASTITFDTAGEAILSASEASTIRYKTQPTPCEKRCDIGSIVASSK